MAEVCVPLPGGLWFDGERVVEAHLRAPEAGPAVAVAEAAARLAPAHWATQALAGCGLRLGGAAARLAPEEAARRLSAGDREALLLHVRRLLVGERLACVVACPGCGEAMDVPLRVADVLLPHDPAAPAVAEADVAADGVRARVRLRRPDGADLEAAADAARAAGSGGRSGAPAEDAVLVAFLRRVVAPADGTALPDAALAALADPISQELARLDPQAEILLDVACSGCGRPVQALLDATEHAAAAFVQHVQRLEAEVHALALHYHWSEEDILRLPPERRARYLRLLGVAA